ncbi:hypothetical protein [Streptomyces corynorhini]|uniref:Uncharacterized protein n=1 Tax=Streptomyces corynorhini TaxID=2282652 RepID=A0A370B3E9_9ACTN|nr:hypothetical protein [Streptomyces corynorhini]RDG34594.1 hypothetical protein DVH02_29725 [Streptomyces corynorhini]
MTTATFTPASAAPVPGPAATDSPARPAHSVGGAMRAVRVFLSTAFSVAVMGEYREEAGIKRR